MKLITIIKAKLRNKEKLKKEKWYTDRLNKCNACEFNSKHITENKNLKYWIFRILNLLETFCTKCGCEIKAKASEKMEQCPLSKW